jgi:hypothetical protein
MWQKGYSDTRLRTSFFWPEAEAYCVNLSLSGYTDWRLPSLIELLSVVAPDRQNPAIYPAFQMPNVNATFWSSTPMAMDPSYSAWVIDFGAGSTRDPPGSEANFVRCVRGGQ